MPTAINNSLIFLINTLFDLYLFVLVVRFILVWIHADYYHPVTQFIIKLTQKPVLLLKKILPNIQRIEISSLALILLLETVKYFFIIRLNFGFLSPSGLFILASADSLKLFASTFFYAILLQAILSWIQPYSPVAELLHQFTSPIMRPIQRWMPPIAHFDLSPIPALIGLQLFIMLIVNPLMGMGIGLLST